MFKKRIDSNEEEPVVNTKPVVPVEEKWLFETLLASVFFL